MKIHRSGRPSSRAVIEGLESRRMLSASINHHGVLNVHGTGHADDISVTLDAQDSSKLDVSINGVIRIFNAAEIRSLKIDAAGGENHVTVDPTLDVPTKVTGDKAGDGGDADPGAPGDGKDHGQ